MSKLSKISKVILLSGIFVVSLSLSYTDVSWAATQAEKAQTKAGEAAAAKKQSDQAIQDWEKYRDARDEAQEAYTQASMEYNKCVASNGAVACSSAKAAMDTAQSNLDNATKAYNDAQKTASKYANDTTRAQNQADAAAQKAEQEAKKADEKALQSAERDLQKAQRALEKCQKDANADCSSEQQAVATAQQQVSAAQSKVDSYTKASASADNSVLEALQQEFDSQTDAGKQSDALNQIRIYRDSKEQAARSAEAECERYSAMTSSDAMAKAQAACSQAVSLRSEADAASAAYDAAKQNIASLELGESVTTAQRRLRVVGKGDTGVVDISQSRQIGDSGPYTLAGYRSQYFNYSTGEDVLDKVTRRAALTIASLKPIVYVFAGFGLIAFAWMAIFNKISWRWFANIAMGLFLVANMGRFIEYFVVGDGDQHYYVGVWGSNTAQAGKTNSLANAFVDSYYVYGDTSYDDVGIRYFKEQEAQNGNTVTEPEEFKASAAGFCQGTSGSGWANFTSCVNDIVSTAKKVADTAKDVKAAVDDVKARVETVKDSAANIKQAAEAMKGASLTEIIANAGTILNNVNNVVSTTTGAVGSLTNTVSSVSNNVQDMGKSVEQQQELQSRRNQGEATNAVDAAMKGQEWNSAAGGVENVDGQWASQDNFITNANDFADDIRDKSSTINNSAQDMTQQVGAVTNIVENASIGEPSINEKRQAAQDAAQNNRPNNASSGNNGSNNTRAPSVSNSTENSGGFNNERSNVYENNADSSSNSLNMNNSEASANVAASDVRTINFKTNDNKRQDEVAYIDTNISDSSPNTNYVAEGTQNNLSNQSSRNNYETTEQRFNNSAPKLGGISTETARARQAYDNSVAAAQEARLEYNQAVAEDRPQAEVKQLQQVYNDKLTVMSDAKNNYEQKVQLSDNLSQQPKEASKTPEVSNVAKVEKLSVVEVAEPQEITKDITKINAQAQASKNSYVEQKNKADIAGYTLKEKETVADQAKKHYEEAAKQCEQTKDETTCRVAERLQKTYELSVNELNVAQQEYDKLTKSLVVYERDYKEKSLEAEIYNQQQYQAEMKKSAVDINTYEVLVSQQRQVVEEAASAYTQAKNNLQDGDEAGLKQAVELYNNYKEAKELYDKYQNMLNQAKSNYDKAQGNDEKSVETVKSLEAELAQ